MQFLNLVLCFSIQLSASFASGPHFLSDGYIKELNSQQDLWKAGRNFPADTPLSEIKKLMGTFMESREKKRGFVKSFDPLWPEDKKIPRRFDARKKWHKKCPRIAEVLDQGKCGSCWAISAAQAFTDRYCIATKGKHQMRLSTANVVSCCTTDCGNGCRGGWESDAWNYFNSHGLPSGGTYNSSEGCQPYNVISPCHRTDGDPYEKCEIAETPKCYDECYNTQYKKKLSKDYRYANKLYSLPADEKAIMKEIMTHGPVTVVFLVYEDFLSYKSGVYEPTYKNVLGGHAVKMIGWGVEKNVPYWLIQNSWNEYWGYHGLVKIKRNCPDIPLDQTALAATADTKRHGETVKIEEAEGENLSGVIESGDRV